VPGLGQQSLGLCVTAEVDHVGVAQSAELCGGQAAAAPAAAMEQQDLSLVRKPLRDFLGNFVERNVDAARQVFCPEFLWGAHIEHLGAGLQPCAHLPGGQLLVFTEGASGPREKKPHGDQQACPNPRVSHDAFRVGPAAGRRCRASAAGSALQ